MPDTLETLASYVPALVSHRLAADPTPIAAPVAEEFPAAALFADIAGFTALTERLAQRGPEGAEELTVVLNTYFGTLVDLINIHGGDVVKFAGDSLLALWPAAAEGAGDPAEALAIVTQRAAQCALAVQAAMRGRADGAAPETSPLGRHAQLRLKVGIGAGEAVTVHVGGGYGRWEFVVAGDALVQMSAAVHTAQPADVNLSPEAWALVDEWCEGTPVGDDKGTRRPGDRRHETGDTRHETGNKRLEFES